MNLFCRIKLPNWIAELKCRIEMPNQMPDSFCQITLPNCQIKYILLNPIAKTNCWIEMSNWNAGSSNSIRFAKLSCQIELPDCQIEFVFAKSICQIKLLNWNVKLPIETKRIRTNEQDQAIVDEQSQELVVHLTLTDQRLSTLPSKQQKQTGSNGRSKQACEFGVRIEW
jgi:hypothetical protein